MGDETDRLLGEISGKLSSVDDRLSRHEGKIDSTISGIGDLRNETTIGFGDIKADIVGLHQKVNSHIEEDSRKHATIDQDVETLHDRISSRNGVAGWTRNQQVAAGSAAVGAPVGVYALVELIPRLFGG